MINITRAKSYSLDEAKRTAFDKAVCYNNTKFSLVESNCERLISNRDIHMCEVRYESIQILNKIITTNKQ